MIVLRKIYSYICIICSVQCNCSADMSSTVLTSPAQRLHDKAGRSSATKAADNFSLSIGAE